MHDRRHVPSFFFMQEGLKVDHPKILPHPRQRTSYTATSITTTNPQLLIQHMWRYPMEAYCVAASLMHAALRENDDHQVHNIKSIGWLIETSPHACIRIVGGAARATTR